jgi:hypothetical protein
MIKAKDEHQQQQNIAVIRAYLFSTHHKKFFISWCSFPRERLRCAYSKINLLSWSGVADDPKLSCRFNSKGQTWGDMAGMDAHAHRAWSMFLAMTKSCNCNAEPLLHASRGRGPSWRGVHPAVDSFVLSRRRMRAWYRVSQGLLPDQDGYQLIGM